MPEKDEDLSSYLERLLEDNGIFNASQFFRHISNKEIVDSRTEQYPLGFIFRMIEEQKSVVGIFLETTNYDLESIFMTSAEQAFYLSKAFAAPETMHKYCSLFLSKSYIHCPLCKREVDMGKAIRRKIFKSMLYHACPYHLYNFSNPLLRDLYINEAKYIKRIQDARPDLNVEELYAIIGYIDPPKRRKTMDEILLLVMNAYPDVDELIDVLPDSEIYLNYDSEYEILSIPKNNITGFKHIPCGTVFCMNSSGFNVGIRCPRCQAKRYSLKEIEEMIECHFEAMSLNLPDRSNWSCK